MNLTSISSPPAENPLYTVGHSNHEFPVLLHLLQRAGVTAIADVRSHPYSQRHPQYHRERFRELLAQQHLAYVFLGDLLGGRPSDPDVYDEEGRVDYERVRKTRVFEHGLERVMEGAKQFTIALLCGEEDPLECHRGLMIAPALVEFDIAPLHLRKDGTVETTPQIQHRLLQRAGLAEEQDTLFVPPEQERKERLAEAYRRWGKRKAYRRGETDSLSLPSPDGV